MTYRRIYAIPDIHGRTDLLDLLLKKMAEDGYDRAQDRIVFLGDYIDRGPDSKGVLDRVKGLVEAGDADALAGNHEGFPLDYYVRHKIHARDLWEWNGGIKTMASYARPAGDGQPYATLPRMHDDHLRFLASLPFSLELQGFFFSHAPVPREKARTKWVRRLDGRELAEASSGEYCVEELTWTCFGSECERKGGMMDVHEGPLSDRGKGREHLVGVCGHIHRGPSAREVRLFPRYRMLDCGCGCFPEGSLAAHECLSGRTLYARPEDLRTDMAECRCNFRPVGLQPHADTTCPEYLKHRARRQAELEEAAAERAPRRPPGSP